MFRSLPVLLFLVACSQKTPADLFLHRQAEVGLQQLGKTDRSVTYIASLGDMKECEEVVSGFERLRLNERLWKQRKYKSRIDKAERFADKESGAYQRTVTEAKRQRAQDETRYLERRTWLSCTPRTSPAPSGSRIQLMVDESPLFGSFSIDGAEPIAMFQSAVDCGKTMIEFQRRFQIWGSRKPAPSFLCVEMEASLFGLRATDPVLR